MAIHEPLTAAPPPAHEPLLDSAFERVARVADEEADAVLLADAREFDEHALVARRVA